MNAHSDFLKRTLQLARLRRGYCAPNPSVGALLVRDNQTLAEGFHWQAGAPHAEIAALQKIGADAIGATLYVSIEPCCHTGKTPPCTDAIIQAGVREVYYAHRDPNPLVQGQGAARLRAAGIHCEEIAIPQIDQFYQSYAHWQQAGMPWVTAKLAQSLDGKIAWKTGKPMQLTGDAANRFTHECRDQSDAILTTVKTIINDDPQLNVRLDTGTYAKPLYIIDRNLNLPLTAKIFQTTKSITLFHQDKVDSKNLTALDKRNVRLVKIENTDTGLFNLTSVLKAVGADGIHDLFVEAGGTLLKSMLMQKLIHTFYLYHAPVWVGEEGLSAFNGTFAETPKPKSIAWRELGIDSLCEITW